MKWGDAMVPLRKLTKETILSKEVLDEVFDQEDELLPGRTSGIPRASGPPN